MLYGNTMYEKGRTAAYNGISNKLKNMARLLLQFRKSEGIDVSFNDIIAPNQWDAVVKNVKVLVQHAGIDNVGKPSMLLRIGKSLETMASAKRAVGIKERNGEIIADARAFLELHSDLFGMYTKLTFNFLKIERSFL